MLVLISAERATLDDETNALRTERLACRLKRERIPFERGRGTWGGRSEAVFAVTIPDWEQVNPLRKIACAFQQDALLIVQHEDAWLYWLWEQTHEDRMERVGPWREVSEAEAKAAGDWTELGGRYWRAG